MRTILDASGRDHKGTKVTLLEMRRYLHPVTWEPIAVIRVFAGEDWQIMRGAAKIAYTDIVERVNGAPATVGARLGGGFVKRYAVAPVGKYPFACA